MTMGAAYCGTRLRRSCFRLPSHCTLPRHLRMEVCSCVFTKSRRASSTAAFLVAAPLRRIACRIKSSSISILVRTTCASRCVNISHSCVLFNGEPLHLPGQVDREDNRGCPVHSDSISTRQI